MGVAAGFARHAAMALVACHSLIRRLVFLIHPDRVDACYKQQNTLAVQALLSLKQQGSGSVKVAFSTASGQRIEHAICAEDQRQKIKDLVCLCERMDVSVDAELREALSAVEEPPNMSRRAAAARRYDVKRKMDQILRRM